MWVTNSLQVRFSRGSGRRGNLPPKVGTWEILTGIRKNFFIVAMIRYRNRWPEKALLSLEMFKTQLEEAVSNPL